tara:strand:- start:664 stop:933 length:270 start_codon:yes stop_codon:yes gene_type:complete
MAKKEKQKKLEDNNVVTISGKQYAEESLKEEAKYFIAQIRDIETQVSDAALQVAQSRFKLDQKQAALDMMKAKLIACISDNEEIAAEAS